MPSLQRSTATVALRVLRRTAGATGMTDTYSKERRKRGDRLGGEDPVPTRVREALATDEGIERACQALLAVAEANERPAHRRPGQPTIGRAPAGLDLPDALWRRRRPKPSRGGHDPLRIRRVGDEDARLTAHSDLGSDLLEPTTEGSFRDELKGLLSDPKVLAGQAARLAKRLGFNDPFHLYSVISVIDRPAWRVESYESPDTVPEITDPSWKPALEPHKDRIAATAKKVGAIVLVTPAGETAIGTAWYLSRDILVTNRHVAKRFSAHSQQGGFAFLGQVFDNQPLRQVLVSVHGPEAGQGFQGPRVVEVMYMDESFDVALLRVEETDAHPLPDSGIPLALTLSKEPDNAVVVTLGFPLYNPDLITKEMLSVPEDKKESYRQVLKKYFIKYSGQKMMMPGRITQFEGGRAHCSNVLHNCSTLAGNSGSVLLNPQTGQAVGLHYGGIVLTTNFAVPAPALHSVAVQQRLL